jgi:hypothetical protein
MLALSPTLTLIFQVQQSARSALRAIGSIITNPEIEQHVPILLKALDNPTAHSAEVLDALINTSFVHHIDAPSLSLLIPILDRSLRDPSTDLKVKAAQIVGNMCSLTEQKDLSPYLNNMVEQMKVLLMDPIPTTRASAARALGSLVRGMGENSAAFARELVMWLLRTIESSSLSEVERSGAAQGLAEVIAALETLDTQPHSQTARETLDLDEEVDRSSIDNDKNKDTGHSESEPQTSDTERDNEEQIHREEEHTQRAAAHQQSHFSSLFLSLFWFFYSSSISLSLSLYVYIMSIHITSSVCVL